MLLTKKIDKKNKQIFIFLIDMFFEIYKENKNIYKKVLEPMLEEKSHSFGFKPLSNLEYFFSKKIDDLFDFELEGKGLFYDYYYGFSSNITKKELIKKLLNDDNSLLYKGDLFYNKCFKTYIEVLKELDKIDYKYGNFFAMLLDENKENSKSMKYNFSIIYNLKQKYIELGEKILLPELHDFKSEGYKNYGGWIYWFCIENEFGNKKLYINHENKRYKVNNINGFLKVLKKIENK
jgi:hypothetical protein